MNASLNTYYQVAAHLHTDGDIPLAIFGSKIVGIIKSGLFKNVELLQRLDELTGGKTSQSVYDALGSLNEKISSLSGLSQSVKSDTEALEVITTIDRLLCDFEIKFIGSTIFMPQSKWDDHLSHFRSKQEILGVVQPTLHEISVVRRELWRCVEHFKSLSKNRSGYGVIDVQTEINVLLEEAMKVERSKYPIEHRCTDVTYQGGEGIQSIATDRPRLLNSCREIIRNGLFATIGRDDALRPIASQGAKVEVSSAQGAEGIIIAIDDNGIGIPRERLPLITQYGFTHSEPGRQFGGRGIGLSIAKLTAQEHGGELLVIPKSKGVRVEIKIPVSTFLTKS